jgi:ferrochelatase
MHIRADPPAPVGIVVSNIGTPQAPTTLAVRRYLREFLSDPRVVEAPRLLWWLVLNLVVLRTRPRHSARLYRKIWAADGSPLLLTTERIAGRLGDLLSKLGGREIAVAVGMRYGVPSITTALEQLHASGCQRMLVVPLYPQYSASTSGSTFDAVAATLRQWRRVPALRVVTDYHDHTGYIRALAASVDELWRRDGRGDRLLLSFHSLPRRYCEAGDPYPQQCETTARLLAGELGISPDQWLLSYQSRFGRQEWIRPSTTEAIVSLAQGGCSVDVLCPGFAVDCLETLEEVAITDRKLYLAHGGRRFRYIPALNDRDVHIEALRELAIANLGGWL